MHDETVTVLENRKVNAKYFKISFRSRRLASGVEPGQFVQIKVREGWDPYLRRPFSYYRVRGDQVGILYEILGRGSELLSKLAKGTCLQVMGPLGRGFSREIRGKKRILVGGGVGVPPLVFVAELYGCDRFYIGTKSRHEVLPRGEIRKFHSRVFHTTQDGSYGVKGLVTESLEEWFRKDDFDPGGSFIQTCGPTGMMERVMEIASHFGVEGEASWEERMACGVGVCLGCMVWTHHGWTPSCTEGPVFRFDETENIQNPRVLNLTTPCQ